jgi:hypothetical protein
MSKRKTSNDARSPEPVVSPRRRLRRQGAEDRKMAAWAKQRKIIARALLKKLNEDNASNIAFPK